MPKELFNAGQNGNTGSVKTTLSADDRIATGQPSQGGSDNITFENFYKQVSGRVKVEFSNADLASGVLTVTHNLNTRNISVEYQDETYTKQSLDGLLKFTDLDYFEIDFGGAISAGTHTLYYKSNPDA